MSLEEKYHTILVSCKGKSNLLKIIKHLDSWIEDMRLSGQESPIHNIDTTTPNACGLKLEEESK